MVMWLCIRKATRAGQGRGSSAAAFAYAHQLCLLLPAAQQGVFGCQHLFSINNRPAGRRELRVGGREGGVEGGWEGGWRGAWGGRWQQGEWRWGTMLLAGNRVSVS